MGRRITSSPLDAWPQMNGVKVYGSFDNVALFSHLDGMDPQYNFSGGTNYDYAPNKTLTFGVEVNF